MKFSELDITKLNDNDIYDLVMSGIRDYSKEDLTDENNPDFIVILGCTPLTLEQRILKLIELYDRGYGKYIILTGGFGWHKLFKADPNKSFKDDEDLMDYSRRLNQNLKRQIASLSKIFEKQFKPSIPDKYQGGSYFKKLYKTRRKLMGEYLEDSEAELGYRIISSRERNDIQDITLLESNSVNTIQNVLYTRDIVEDLEINGGLPPTKRIMLVTSPFHCRRAALSFKKYFSNVEILTCPSTAGMEKKQVPFSKTALMNNDYYMKQFRNECDAIINYSKKGDIADIDISLLLGQKRAAEIEEKMTGLSIEH